MNDKNNRLFQFINATYKYFYIVGSFARKLLWFSSCGKLLFILTDHNIVAFMYLMPMSFEIFTEQQRILSKIQMQMMNDTMMGGDMGQAPQMRPF